jgi:dolichyl-phosphate beta-glucosyltransferase
LLSYDRNRGKGYAVRLGMLSARGSQRIFADADGSTPIAEIEKLQAKLSGGCDIAIGSRALPQTRTETVIRPHRRVIAAAFRLLRNILLPLDVVDSQCGFKLFTAAAAQAVFGQMKIDGMAFDVEALYLARRAKLQVAEVPVNWTDSYPSTIRLWSDPFKMARDLIRIRMLHRT